MCHDDEDDALRARARGRELLRLLARALLRVRPAPARASPTCGTSTRSAAPSTATTPRRCTPPAANDDRLGAKVVAGGHRRAARRGRHARPDPRVPAALRGVRRRPGDLLLPGRARTATSTSWRALELFGREVLPEFTERDEQAAARQGPTARAGHRAGDGPQARESDHPPLPTPDYDFPAIPRAMADRVRHRRLPPWLDQFAEQSAAADSELQNLLG